VLFSLNMFYPKLVFPEYIIYSDGTLILISLEICTRWLMYVYNIVGVLILISLEIWAR